MAIAVEIVDYTVTSGHSVVGGVLKELKILMFVENGEKDTSRDKTSNLDCCMIFKPYG